MNDKEKLLRDYGRMCKYYRDGGHCVNCCIRLVKASNDCWKNLIDYTNACISGIECWAEEHPVKTRQREFLKRYPDAATNPVGVIDIDPCKIDSKLSVEIQGGIICRKVEDCATCRYDYWSQEVAENE